jgi:hypothetical protein
MAETHPTNPDRPNQRLDAYLDGQMTPDERKAFEQELAGDPQIRRECELQRELDASLARQFAAPSPPDILAVADRQSSTAPTVGLPEHSSTATVKNRRAIFAVLAASIAWAIVGWKMYLQSNDDGYQQVALADIYQKCVDNGFRPKWVCDDDREFAETFQRRQGSPLLLKTAAKDMMVGLSYLKGITSQTTTMLARVDGEPILVFVDVLQRDTNPAQPAWSSGLHLFRQELAGLVLYEVTPLDQPRVLSNFYIPESTELPTSNAEKNSDDSP